MSDQPTTTALQTQRDAAIVRAASSADIGAAVKEYQRVQKTLDEALLISNKTVAEALDGLPPEKMHCSNLAADALHAAIEDYRQKQSSGAQSK